MDLNPLTGDFHRVYFNNSKGLRWVLERTHFKWQDLKQELLGTQLYQVTIFQVFLEEEEEEEAEELLATLIWLAVFTRLEETQVYLGAHSEVIRLGLIQIYSETQTTGLVCNLCNLEWCIQTRMSSIRLLPQTFSNQKVETTFTQPFQAWQDQIEIPLEVVLIRTSLCD